MSHDRDDPSASLHGCCLVLRDNDWSACSIDGMTAPWRELTPQAPRGFASVSAGRHQVVTTRQGQAITLDVVLYPGEILVRRLDPEAGQWVLDDVETEARFRELAQGGKLGAMSGALVDYSRAVLAAKGAPTPLLPRERLERACAMFASLAAGLAGGSLEDLMPQAERSGLELAGFALLDSDLRSLVGLMSGQASRHAAAGDYARALQITVIALAMMPGDPWLFDLMANLCSDAGSPERGIGYTREAVRRSQVYPPEVQEQMQGTLREVSEALAKKEAEAAPAPSATPAAAGGEDPLMVLRKLVASFNQKLDGIVMADVLLDPRLPEMHYPIFLKVPGAPEAELLCRVRRSFSAHFPLSIDTRERSLSAGSEAELIKAIWGILSADSTEAMIERLVEGASSEG